MNGKLIPHCKNAPQDTDSGSTCPTRWQSQPCYRLTQTSIHQTLSAIVRL